MIDTSKLSQEVRFHLADAEIDEDAVRQMNAQQCFEAWLRYEGIIGYSAQLIRVLDNIREAEVKL